jgi:hypothetical protein
MAEFQMAGPMSEKEVEARFAEHGIDYKTRAERYEKLNGTPFATINPNYWIAYYPTVEEGKPLAVQGIGGYKDIYLLTGLVSHAAKSGLSEEETKGAGSWISNKVIDMHSNRPIVGAAKKRGVGVFERQGFQPIRFDSNNKVIDQDDIPDDIREVFTMLENEGSETTAIRKLYYKPSVQWFALVKAQCKGPTKKTSSTAKGKKWMKCVSKPGGGYKRVHWGQRGVTVSGKRSGKRRKSFRARHKCSTCKGGDNSPRCMACRDW